MDNVQHPPAFCKAHGIFPATAFELAPGASIAIINCLTSCPICHGPAEILPGTHSAFRDRISVILDPSVSLQALAALESLAKAVSENRISAVEAQRQAEDISSGTGRLFDFSNWDPQAKATLVGAIATAIALVVAAKLSSPTIINQPVIERAVPRLPNHPLPGLPGGAPYKSDERRV